MYVITFQVAALMMFTAHNRWPNDWLISSFQIRMRYKCCQFDKLGALDDDGCNNVSPEGIYMLRRPSITNFDRKYTFPMLFWWSRLVELCCINLIVARITSASFSRLFSQHRYFRRRMRVVQHWQYNADLCGIYSFVSRNIVRTLLFRVGLPIHSNWLMFLAYAWFGKLCESLIKNSISWLLVADTQSFSFSLW